MMILTGKTLVSAIRPPYPYGTEFVQQFLFMLRLCWLPLPISTIAFGYGAHFCIGAALARMETRIGLTETLKRFPDFEVDEDALEFVHTATVRGYKSVPMRVR